MFYDKGLKFECQMCRYCCSSEPGYVYLTKDDIEKASKHFGIDFDSFIKTYCRLVDFGPYFLVSLQETPDYDCIFLSSMQNISILEERDGKRGKLEKGR